MGRLVFILSKSHNIHQQLKQSVGNSLCQDNNHSASYTGLFKMIVGVFIHNTLEIGVYVFFYLIEQQSRFLLHTLQVLYMCTFVILQTSTR